MRRITHRLRSLLIALAVLALSATAAFAGRSALSAPGQRAADQHVAATASDEAGEGADVDSPDGDSGTDADEDVDEAPAASDADARDGAEEDAGAPETDAAGELDNHGALVSTAAEGATPAGFASHGAYVRTIARQNHGHEGDAAAPRITKGPKGGKAGAGGDH